jgi:hypothetical protein
MRAPSSQKCRLDLVPPLADRFILGFPIDYGPVLLRRPFGFHLAMDTLPSEVCSKRWLQVGLGCVQLSPSCPFRPLHTFRFSPASEAVNPASWIWRPSFERQRDFNPPEQRAAQRALPCCRPEPSRWPGGRFAVTSLIRQWSQWSLEGLAVARYDGVNMDSDVSSISMSINNGLITQLLSIQQLPAQSRFKSHSSPRPPQTPAASF